MQEITALANANTRALFNKENRETSKKLFSTFVKVRLFMHVKFFGTHVPSLNALRTLGSASFLSAHLNSAEPSCISRFSSFWEQTPWDHRPGSDAHLVHLESKHHERPPPWIWCSFQAGRRDPCTVADLAHSETSRHPCFQWWKLLLSAANSHGPAAQQNSPPKNYENSTQRCQESHHKNGHFWLLLWRTVRGGGVQSKHPTIF